MNWFKSLWLKVRLPNGRIPRSTVLIPMTDKVTEEEVIVVKAKRKPRKKKETSNETTDNK